MVDIVIGKHTLESLTSGMYSDPFVVYREYIQNATDAIDDAIEKGFIVQGDARISININPADRRVSIEDNGCGVPASVAVKTLVSIGNSRKDYANSRGFRGIGRLSALSYCSTLTFETSYPLERVGTRVTIDAKQLSKLLLQSSNEDISVVDVLQQVYSHSLYPEKENRHYFRVILDGIDTTSRLTNLEKVISYISQNAPVPYDTESFPWGYEITQRIRNHGISIRSYNITVCCANQQYDIFKPYKNTFLVEKGKQIYDSIQDIEIVKFSSHNGDVSAIGWLAKTSFLGSIYDKSVKGLRIRKGNILIGDHQTLNILFKDARFNGWSIGEVFVVAKDLIPNARRDNFEKNAAYFSLMEQLTPMAAAITKSIRAASTARNQELSAALIKVENISSQAYEALDTGIHGTEKGSLKCKLMQAHNMLSELPTKGDADVYFQEIAFEELDMLLGKVKGATSYKALNTLSKLSTTEKQILERVFNILVAAYGENASQTIDTILAGFSP